MPYSCCINCMRSADTDGMDKCPTCGAWLHSDCGPCEACREEANTHLQGENDAQNNAGRVPDEAAQRSGRLHAAVNATVGRGQGHASEVGRGGAGRAGQGERDRGVIGSEADSIGRAETDKSATASTQDAQGEEGPARSESRFCGYCDQAILPFEAFVPPLLPSENKAEVWHRRCAAEFDSFDLPRLSEFDAEDEVALNVEYQSSPEQVNARIAARKA